MKFQLVSDTTKDLLLDRNVHRAIWQGRELCNNGQYSVKMSISGTDHCFNISKGNIANYKSCQCNFVQIPPNLHVPIALKGGDSQVLTPVDFDNQRIIDMGIDVSTQADTHFTFITDSNGPTITDYLLVVDATSVEKIPMGGEGWKRPPDTGVN